MIVKDTFQIYENRNPTLIKIKLSRLIGLLSIFLLHIANVTHKVSNQVHTDHKFLRIIYF